ncbi:MAG: ParA family protein [Desulfobacteraceae bacterium]|uniref:ParA family protein n=1 Tax=Candidatus Desulfacyla euxinica TaxID=2841693 RepID=A0A8J6N3V9_9DELT|nr:ParA family protein [Candidatus Desulfacyla euxinica]MBL6977624.1 ParA family protein [Desulfobacteraceae bacterium]MBL7216211.1 ParA family protein [Desulfobacteraceae bacterium]
MRKIAVSLTKGGVGKTTTAVNLAAGLALAGFRVLLIDTDTQGQAGFMLGLQPEGGLAELVTGALEPEEAIVEARQGLWLLAGGVGLAGVKKMIASNELEGEQTLTKALATLDEKYDYVILDTSPGWDTMTINVLFYADEVLVPVSLEILTIKGLAEFNKRLDAIKRHKAISLTYVLPTFMDRRVRKSAEILEQLQSYYPGRLCPPIRYNVRLSEAAGYGEPIFEFAPNSPGAEDYKILTERIMNEE